MITRSPEKGLSNHLEWFQTDKVGESSFWNSCEAVFWNSVTRRIQCAALDLVYCGTLAGDEEVHLLKSGTFCSLKCPQCHLSLLTNFASCLVLTFFVFFQLSINSRVFRGTRITCCTGNLSGMGNQTFCCKSASSCCLWWGKNESFAVVLW